MNLSRRRKRRLPGLILPASAVCRNSTAVNGNHWRLVQISGPVWDWFAAVQELHWSAIQKSSPRGSESTPVSALIVLFSPAIHIWKRHIAWLSSSFLCYRLKECRCRLPRNSSAHSESSILIQNKAASKSPCAQVHTKHGNQ